MKERINFLKEYQWALSNHQALFASYQDVYHRWTEASFSSLPLRAEVVKATQEVGEVQLNIDFEVFREKIDDINPFLKPKGVALTLAEEAFVQSIMAASVIEYAHPGALFRTIGEDQLAQFGAKWRYQATRAYFIDIMHILRTFAVAEVIAYDQGRSKVASDALEVKRYLEVQTNEKHQATGLRVLNAYDKKLPENQQVSVADQWTLFRIDVRLNKNGLLEETMGGLVTLH